MEYSSMNWIGRAKYRSSIIHYILGSYQATRLPNRKQQSGDKIGEQTIKVLSEHRLLEIVLRWQ